jgi:hypothetical protein
LDKVHQLTHGTGLTQGAKVEVKPTKKSKLDKINIKGMKPMTAFFAKKST